MIWRQKKANRLARAIHSASRRLAEPGAQSNQPKNRRIMFLGLLLFLFWGLVVVRLFNLQVLNYGLYAAWASDQQAVYKKLFPERGRIFVRSAIRSSASWRPVAERMAAANPADSQSAGLYPIVANQDYNLVYAVPLEIEDATATAKELNRILELDKELESAEDGEIASTDETTRANFLIDLASRLNKKDDPYEPVKHKVKDEQVAQIKELKLAGVGFAKESFRYYPEGDFASQILGFVGFEGDQLVGRYGLESYFNEELAGQSGLLDSEKDAAGYLITVGRHLFREAKNGSDLVLTLDRTIQFTACQKLKEAVEWHQADSGSLIIMEPFTGAIIAMCNFPAFNPDEYEQVEDVKFFNNDAIFDAYEPGSVFKAITMATALDTGKITPQSVYNDDGPLKFHDFSIKNSDNKYHGIQTMVDVLDKSLNTGAVYTVMQTGGGVFAKYVADFGFGSQTNIELNSESAGNISSLKKPGEIYYATASYGQGITATALQLVTAFSAIANGGKLVKPYIVDEIISPDGQSIKTEPKVIRQVISPRTAVLLQGMLVSVVKGVHGENAGVDGYLVAGKTGTAQIPRKDGLGYEKNAHIGTFVGFAPVDNPRFSMIIRIVRPKSVEFAESSAAPLFGGIAKFLLNYYQVPPDNLGQ
ncbi:MAG: penicillin-binding protein 2 [bacterium]